MLCLILFVSSCQDDFELDNSSISDSVLDTRNTNASNSGANRGKTNTTKYTILGTKRNNPFTVSAINNASGIYYGSSYTPVVKTHTYVKFLPTTQDHLATLEDWEYSNLNPMFDFPLEYNIIEVGEHYYDPSVSDSLFTYQYTTIPDGLPYPTNVPFENIDDLYLDDTDPMLLAISFHLTGNDSEIDSYINGEDGIDPINLNGPNPLPPIIECPVGMYPVLIVDNTYGTPHLMWVCRLIVELDLGGGSDGPPVNECDCTIPADKSKPAGCVQVEESATQAPEAVVSVLF